MEFELDSVLLQWIDFLYALVRINSNSIFFSSGQDFKPVSVDVGAGTIMSILLALVLFVVFLIICGPLIYKKLVKKCK